MRVNIYYTQDHYENNKIDRIFFEAKSIEEDRFTWKVKITTHGNQEVEIDENRIYDMEITP